MNPHIKFLFNTFNTTFRETAAEDTWFDYRFAAVQRWFTFDCIEPFLPFRAQTQPQARIEAAVHPVYAWVQATRSHMKEVLPDRWPKDSLLHATPLCSQVGQFVQQSSSCFRYVSAKSTSGNSLNDLNNGGFATVQPDLLSIILRFRFWRFVFIADIASLN